MADQIMDELEPLLARQRQATAQVWLDRSVSKSNLYILMLLDQFGPLAMSKLASLLDVSLPNLTGIVDRMEEHGLIERDRDDADRRVVRVQSTPKGQAVVQEMEDARTRHMREILCALSSRDRRACLLAFKAMRDAAERIAATDPSTDHPPMVQRTRRRHRAMPAGH